MEKINGWKYVPIVGGVLFAVIGLLTILFPGKVLNVLPVFLGIVLLLTGGEEVINGWRNRDTSFRYFMELKLMQGILNIGIGFIFICKQDVSLLFLTVFIGMWALMTSCMKITMAIRMALANVPWGWYMLDGVVQLLFALFIVLYPFAGAITMTIAAGFYMLYIGVSVVMFVLYIDNHMDMYSGRF